MNGEEATAGGQPADPPHIVFVASPGPLGGSNVSLLTLLQTLGDRVERTVVAPDGIFLETVAKEGHAEHVVSMPRRPRNRTLRLIWFAYAAVWLAFRLRRHRSRIALLHANATNGARLAAIAGRVWSIPTLVWVHDSSVSRNDRLTAWLYRALLYRPRWYAVSEAAAEVPPMLGLAEAESIGRIPNPVSVDRAVGGERVPSRRLRIGYLGRATPGKGFDVAVGAVQRLRNDDVEWRLFTKRGVNDWSEPLWRELDREEPGYVHVQGHRDDVSTAYAECDVVLVPSQRESFGMVVAEAMANGLPVVASDIAAFREVAGEGAALFFEPGSPDSAAAAIRRLAQSEELRSELGRSGRERIRRYEPERIATTMLTAYAEIVESRRGNQPGAGPLG